jgi:hypothetical protein
MTQYPQQYDAGVGEQDEPLPTVVTDVYEEVQVDVVPVGTGNGSADGGTSGGKTDAAKEQAGQLKDSAQQAGQHVAGVAKDQAANVAAETKNQAKDLLSQGREELRQQAGQQQDRLAGSLHSLSQELHSMSQSSQEQGMASDLAREAAERTRAIASWLEQRDPGQLLEDVKDFARRRPGAFLGIAATAGILAGRLGRGIKEGAPDSDQGSSAYGTRSSGAYGTGSSGAYGTGASGGYTGEHLEGDGSYPRYSS